MADMSRKRRSSILGGIPALSLAIAVACSTHLAAQDTSTPEASAEQQIPPGIVVDSVRKTVDLPGYVTTGQNEGKTLGEYEVR